MKRIPALVLAILMLLTMLPTAFAAPAAEAFEKKQHTELQSPLSQKAADVNGNIIETSDMSTEKAITTDDVNKDYTTIKASDFETKGWMEDTPRSGLEMQEQEDTLLGGYWLPSDRFALVDDWYTDNREVFAQVVHPIGEDGEYYQYMEGETVWFNYDIYKAWDNGSQMLVPLDEDTTVNCYLFAGTIEDFSGEEGEGIKMVYAWMSGQSSVSCKVTAPVDDYVYMFVFIIGDTTLTEFGSWVSISYAEEENEFKEIVDGDPMTVGSSVTTDIKGADTVLSLTPFMSDYKLSYGARHAIELQGGQNYVAMFDSPDSIGFHVFFCDENMDVINQTWAGPAAISGGSTYRDFPLIVMPPVTGTYYLVTCGFYMGDEGEFEAGIYEWNDVANPLITSSKVIDLDALGTENYIETVSGTNLWGYFWYPEYSLGELIILYPGNYTVRGNNANVFCDIYDGVNVTLDNATIGSIWKAGEGYAPSVITAKGNATVENTSLQFSIYNYEGVNSGLYLMGDSLTVISGGVSAGAIITESCPVHILTKELNVYSTLLEGNYPVSIWVTGKNHPELTLGGDHAFDGDNQLCEMYYDGSGYFFFGYTVSVHAELYRLHNEPKFNEASLEFELTTNGQLPVPGEDDDDKEYTLSYYVDDELYGTEKHKAGDAITPMEEPAPREGYVFSGWNGVPTRMPAKDVRVDGRFIAENATIYTVTFMDGLTNEKISEVKVEEGTAATAPEAPVHAGYRFVGWDKDFSNVTADMTVTAQYEATGETLLGDVNGDGNVNTGDAVMILKFAAGMQELTDAQQEAANVNNDDKVNTGDAVLILKFAAGLITEF
ncbi:MAG: InlB B-repeat-containing protein [Clostridia bacterium]|nr:InlB B-repeat-containing protein [Clostridia bacterium]